MKLPRRRRRVVWIALPLVLALIVTSHACVTMRMSRGEIATFFSENGIDGELHHLEGEGRRLAWIEAGRKDGALVVFVHGSPGSLSAFIGFFEDRELLSRARVVSVDRPGFGYSDLGRTEPSLAKQARLIAMVIERHRGTRPVILVGHSYGGPVIARLAIDRPDLVDGLVLIAPSIDPELEPKHWFQRPLASPIVRWLVPRPLRASNEEILALEPELRTMLPHWEAIRAPVTVIQGGKDPLVAPGNAQFAKRMLVNAEVELVQVDEMSHFVPWSDPELIRDAIRRQLDRMDASAGKSAR